MRDTEKTTCMNAGITPFEIQIAIDGLSIVVAKSNTFVECLTVAQLNKIWTADASKQASYWDQVNPAWPHQKIDLYGPGTDSGTFDYFVEVVITPFDGANTKGRNDYTPSEDDNVLVKGVSESDYSLGYFGLAYAKENPTKVKVVKVDEGKGNGCMEPTDANVEGGKYTPLARPLFMYTKGRPAGVLKAYFEKGLGAEGQAIVHEVGYIKLPADKLAEMRAKIA
jgi:phosphate transport system substrate-binding protein